MANKLEIASVLAFERKLDPSDALLYGGNWDDRKNSQEWTPITLREKSVRGTMSSRKQAQEVDALRLDGNEKNANLQTVDVATLPAGTDTLKLKFTLRVLAGTGHPSACNDAPYRKKLIATVNNYVQEYGFGELAQRYAANLANGRFLWRNRIGAEQVEVVVSQFENGKPKTSWTFDALSRSLLEPKPAEGDDNLYSLAALIADGLAGKAHVLLSTTAFARIGDGQEVFPSQELIMNRERGDKSKTLYAVDKIAAMHSQKIGNALRTIDTWYPEAEKNGPIAIEPYGSVTTQGYAYRQPKTKRDFFNLLDNWVIEDKVPEPEQQHFLIATLIRGGVFGKAG